MSVPYKQLDVEKVLSQLTIPEKVKLLTGTVSACMHNNLLPTDIISQGWWHTTSLPAKGIPAVRFSDGMCLCSLLRFEEGCVYVILGPNGSRGTRCKYLRLDGDRH